jgi:DNA topoisomerase-1
LDLLVGFSVTPMLWKYISKKLDTGLSAGRCQTPALRLVYDNYLENKSISDGSKTFNISGYFTNMNLLFKLNKNIDNELKVNVFLEETVDFKHTYSCSSPKKVTKPPPKPFTTSTLQQMASNELHYSPKETMNYCQELYENGYITYMRTDCETYSQEFVKDANQYIIKNYSENYINKTPLTTDQNSPHEAIRPTDICIKVVEDSAKINKKSAKLYQLIWRNTMESCMESAIFNTIVAEITSPLNKYKYTSEQMLFKGWKIVKNHEEDDETFNYLLSIKQNSEIKYRKITAEETVKQLPSHYTEAYLVQLLEKKGIGRPSTFAKLVDKLQERSYVKKMNIDGKLMNCSDYALENKVLTRILRQREFGAEKGKLVIQPIGIIVMEFLLKHYLPMFEYDYTKQMEDQLDLVAGGGFEWYTICETCNSEIRVLSESLQGETKCNIKIDDHHFYIIGKHGPTIKYIDPKDGAVSFKQVKPDLDLDILEKGGYKLEDIIEKMTSNKIGKYQGEDLIVRKGKYGLYVTWGDNSKTLSCFGNRPVENITFEEVFIILEKDGVLDPNKSVGFLREITPNISIRRGKYGDYIFYKTSKMKTPKFLKLNGFKEDYRNCEKTTIKMWIRETYQVE